MGYPPCGNHPTGCYKDSASSLGGCLLWSSPLLSVTRFECSEGVSALLLQLRQWQEHRCLLLLPNAGYLRLVHKMPAGIPYPSGDIRVLSPNLQDISGGMQWVMQQADSIQFLAVSGTMVIGDVKAKYDFTLVAYRMHIDEVAWTIFSTLDNALVNEFTEHFWRIVNYKRKDRRGFVDVPWIDARQEYDVAEAYREVRLSIFNNQGHTVRVTTPLHMEGLLPQSASKWCGSVR